MVGVMATKKRELNKRQMNSPVGPILLIASDEFLYEIIFVSSSTFNKEYYDSMNNNENNEILNESVKQLEEYFRGQRIQFDLPLKVEGTSFQKQAWQALTTIPFGHTISYQEQAQVLGDPKKARAIGGANSKNSIPIIIPCHRVIGKNGKLTGFAGGIDIKEALLKHEEKYYKNVTHP
ncbi:methylated-DNA--[protein]-cysteine S-methyltransferase [Bacillus sp. SCS-151]|uniref:methylated-DNA--[protein]-cysteine S-methyltransferase n=1 Tax=Nanhaiella sioensis TaxID=3115293 RepID=UPI00397C2DDB